MSLPALVRILSLDGAHLVDYLGMLHSICQKLSPRPSTNGGVGAAGTKHATAEQAAACLRDALVVVISHDGPVTVYADGIKATADRLEPY